MNESNHHLPDLIAEFLSSIGIEVEARELDGETFMPGIRVAGGVLCYDPSLLKFPGDLLHEAGHLALLPPDERRVAGGDFTGAGYEMGAIAWSYAACTHLGLPLEVLFHTDGYKGDAGWLADTFSAGGYIGLPILQWKNMAVAEGERPELRSLRRITTAILDPERPAFTLRTEIQGLVALLGDLGSFDFDPQEDIGEGSTPTAAGIAISPRMAAMCADDFARTVMFLRGLHAAIAEARKRVHGRPVRILYAGCGPWAILALPLMSIFDARDVAFTLLDIHTESIASVASIIGKLQIADRVEAMRSMDALEYRVSSDDMPDIVLLELLRAVLEAEPQVAVTRHLLAQAPHATLVPECIDVELQLVDPAREFNLGDVGQETYQRERISLGAVFTVNRDRIQSWDEIETDQLPGAELRIPDHDPDRYRPMLFTRIRIHGEHLLENYDSGLSVPRLLASPEVAPGDRLRFHYRLGPKPELVCEPVAN